MSNTDQQCSSLGSFLTSPHLYPHFNRPLGFWPRVKPCLENIGTFYAKLIQGRILRLVVAFTLLLRLSSTSSGRFAFPITFIWTKDPFKDHQRSPSAGWSISDCLYWPVEVDGPEANTKRTLRPPPVLSKPGHRFTNKDRHQLHSTTRATSASRNDHPAASYDSSHIGYQQRSSSRFSSTRSY